MSAGRIGRGGRARPRGRHRPRAAELTLGPRLEYKHVSRGHEFHLSGAAVAAGAGRPAARGVGGPGRPRQPALRRSRSAMAATPVRVNPEALTVEALHHPPRLAVAPGGPVYVSWSSEKPKPEGTLFASDLQLSRSLDGGRTLRAAPARERGPADLALVRRARGGGRRHRAGHVDRRPRGPQGSRHLGRARGRAGHAGRGHPQGRRRHLRVLPRGRGHRGRQHGGAHLAARLPGRHPRHGAGGLARRRAHLRRSHAGERRSLEDQRLPASRRRGGPGREGSRVHELVHGGQRHPART